jgi:hypothetical protein
MVKGGKKVAARQKHAGGRPRMSEEEKLQRVAARLRPGDVQRLVTAAHRRGIPTGVAIRDAVAAFFVLLDEPGAFTRAGVEALRGDLGLDRVEAVKNDRDGGGAAA